MKEHGKGYARIKSITFTNFRNIECGKVDFANGDIDSFYDGFSSITGIYGQNGSGKTAVLVAINILRGMLLGQKITNRNLVKIGCDYAQLSYELSVFDDSDSKYNVTYSFDLFDRKPYSENVVIENDSNDEGASEKKDAVLYDVKNETIEYDGVAFDGKKLKHKVLFSTKDEYCANGTKSFGTQKNTVKDAGYDAIVKNDYLRAKLLARREDASANGCSFLFYGNLDGTDKATHNNMSVPTMIKLSNRLKEHDEAVYQWLCVYGAYIVVSMIDEQGLVSLNQLPLTLFDVSQGYINIRKLISLNKELQLSGKFAALYEEEFSKINGIVSQLIPGVGIKLKYLGEYVSSTDVNNVIKRYELVSIRNGVEVPLQSESNGIKRIVSFVTVLIAAYNNPFVTFAIDEFDSGIFEDLLGKIVMIFEESGKGQLIFTSHNLRPLEVLDWRSIVFTTTNSKNRFIPLQKQKSNNLRDQYLRKIKFGGAAEELYNNPDEYKLKLQLAFSNSDGGV